MGKENLHDHSPETSTERNIFRNLSREELRGHAIEKGHGFQIEHHNSKGELIKGALSIQTRRKSRSAEDKYYVKTPQTEGQVWETVNRPMSPDDYHHLNDDASAHLDGVDNYVMDVALGVPDSPLRKTFRFRTERPEHAFFLLNMYDSLTKEELERADSQDYVPDVTVTHAPDFKADPVTHNTRSEVVNAFNFEDDHIDVTLIDDDYLGILKKLGYISMHYFADRATTEEFKALAIHASIIEIDDTDKAIALFGGSGSGKSSAPPTLKGVTKVGDDEGMLTSGEGINTTDNLEKGLYITVANVNNEIVLRDAAEKDTSILENVQMYPGTKRPNYTDTRATTNIRAAISLRDMKNFKESGSAGPLSDAVFLYPDIWGVAPPIVKLDNVYQTLLYGLIGLGAKVPGREKGVTEFASDFVPWYDKPFLLKAPEKELDKYFSFFDFNQTQGWIISSGWEGGPIYKGERPPVEHTQARVEAIAKDTLAEDDVEQDDVFGWWVPKNGIGLDPRITPDANIWQDQTEYQSQRIAFARRIRDEFYTKYGSLLESNPLLQKLERELPIIPDIQTQENVIFQAAV